MFRIRFKYRLSLILLAVIILLIFLHYIKILIPFENLLVEKLSPVQSVIYSFSTKISNFFSNRKDYNELMEENEKMNSQIIDLIVENTKLKTILEQVEIIEKQIKFLKEREFKYILANVIGRDFLNGFNILILDKGRSDGVKVGVPIIIEKGVMVGKVIKVERNFCHILLITDPQCQTAASIEYDKEINGVVVGEHGLTMKMELIPQEEIVNIKDIVLTSGLEDSVPRGLVIGQVTRIEKTSNSFFQTAYLRSLAQLNNLSIVSIIVGQ